jgi:signal transduction histidine kinase
MYVSEQVPLFVNGNFDKRALELVAGHLMVVNPSLELYLLDTDGKVVASALDTEEDALSDVVVDLQPVKKFLSSDESVLVHGDDPRAPGQKRIFSAYPLADSGIGSSGCEPCGYVYAVLGKEQIASPWQALMSSQTLQFSTLILLAVLLCALLAGLGIFFLLTRPLHTMTESIARWRLFASGLHYSSSSEGSELTSFKGNELEQLEKTCQAMAQRLLRQYLELDNADKRRRQLLTSLSHDLRTPLTSISGALEMLRSKQDTLSLTERQRILSVAYRQCANLQRLIDQVFELARLDSGEVSLELEPVSVQELAMDTVQDFEPHASMKGVNLHFEPSDPDGEFLVNADLGQLNRVLVNLLSNAIKATPAGGTVKLSTDRHQSKGMVVTVTDSGRGFAKELHNIPLSQTDPAMFSNDSGPGTGLGLGIVSRILALHGSEAHIFSVPGKGTQIRFWLNPPALA